MNGDISRIQASRPTGLPEQMMQGAATVERPTEPKPILDGGLSISVGAFRAPGEVQGIEGVEEPSREDALGKLFGELFELPPPEMPNFV